MDELEDAVDIHRELLASEASVVPEASLQNRMTQFFGKLARGFGWGPQPTKVNNVNWSDYANRAFTFLEGPFIIVPLAEDSVGEEFAYELLIHKEINNARNAYSLLRTCKEEEARAAYEAYSKILVPLVDSCGKEVLCHNVLQKVLDFLREHPTWHVAHIVAQFGFVEALKNDVVLAELNSPEEGEGLYPLHVATENENDKTISAIIAAGAQVDMVDKEGNTAVHIAASKSVAVIQALKVKHNPVLNKKNAANKTPLMVAAQHSKMENIKQLIQLGANLNHEEELPDPSNSLYWEKIEKLVLAKEISSKDLHKGGSLLHWVKSRELMDLCLDAGCNPDLRNDKQQTPLHVMVNRNRFQCLMTLLCRGAKANCADLEGTTPLHLAAAQCSATLVQAFIVFGGEINAVNKRGETARHLAASCKIEDKNKSSERDKVIYLLHTVGATRCQTKLAACADGCLDEGNFNGVPLYEKPLHRSRWIMDEQLSKRQISDAIRWQVQNRNGNQRTGRVLCLDGGGIKGLVMTQMLFVIQEIMGRPIHECFDWISGTSTGGFLALMLCSGKSVQDVQSLYYNLKEKVFVGVRPYEAGPLEDILIKEFGEETVMSSIKSPRVMVMSTLADRLPPDLHLFRNYESPMSVLGIEEENVFMSTQPPDNQKVWLAARCSGAAPTYFRPYCDMHLNTSPDYYTGPRPVSPGHTIPHRRSAKSIRRDESCRRRSLIYGASEKFLDGGLVGNNPVLDTLAEIEEWNMAVRAKGREEEVFNPSVVVSLGCGKPPVMLVETVDVTLPSILDVRRGFQALYNLFNVMVEQACSSEGRIVDRARAWCSNLHVPFFRFNPQLSQDVALDEHEDECLVRIMWETRAYMRSQAKILAQLKPLLIDSEVGATPTKDDGASPFKVPKAESSNSDVVDSRAASEEISPDEDNSFHSTIPDTSVQAAEGSIASETGESSAVDSLSLASSEVVAAAVGADSSSVASSQTCSSVEPSSAVEDSEASEEASISSVHKVEEQVGDQL